MSNKNPYSHAADAYGTMAASTDQRALEGKVLLKAAAKLEDLAKRLQSGEKVRREEIGATLEYNQKLWTLFVSETMNADNPLPLEIKNNIASLGLFIFKRTRDLLIETTAEKLKAVIDINRNIAAGLMKQTKHPMPQSSNPLSNHPQESQRPVETATDSLV